MKKLLSAILALAMIASCTLLFASCAKEEKPANTETAETGAPGTEPAETKPAETKRVEPPKFETIPIETDAPKPYDSLLPLIDTDSVASDNPVMTSLRHGEENAASLFDEDDESKWCLVFDPENIPTITFKTVSPVRVMAYDFWTADDTSQYPGRNPTHFNLYGSTDDGANWEQIVDDDLELEPFDFFPCEPMELKAPSSPYTMFRMEFTAIGEGQYMQLSEFTLYGEEAK